MNSKNINFIGFLIIILFLTSCSLLKINKYANNMTRTYNPSPSKFDYVDNQILIKTNIGDTSTVNMFLDLGASKNIIFVDSGFQKHKKNIVPLPMNITTADGKKAPMKAINFGNISTQFINIANSFILIKDEQNTSPCKKLRGLWGAELFMPSPSNQKAKVLVISMQDSMLSVLDSLPDLKNWTQVETKSDRLSSAFYIKMKVGSKSFYFLFNTGNNGNIIMNENDFRSANQNLDSISEAKKYYGNLFRTAAGISFDTVYEYRRSITITENLNVDSVPIRLMKSINHNNVGMEFIQQFNFIVDYQKKNIYLQPNKNYKSEKSSFFALSGFKPTETLNEGYKIQKLVVGSIAEKTGLKIGDEIISINGIYSDSNEPCKIGVVYNGIDINRIDNEIIVKRGDEILKFVL